MVELRQALISIHPDHAAAILSGKKTVELRRRVPDLPPGSKLWIYATRPRGAVVAMATVEQVVRGTPVQIWRAHGIEANVTRSDFDVYFAGCTSAAAIVLRECSKVSDVSLESLRGLRERFHPPQVITWLAPNESAFLKRSGTLRRSAA